MLYYRFPTVTVVLKRFDYLSAAEIAAKAAAVGTA
jgi:hypothetical protein